jgi:hypothetical protein
MGSDYIHFWGILGGVNSGFTPDFFPNVPLTNLGQKWDQNRFFDSRNLMALLFGRGLVLQVDSKDGVFGVTFFKKTLTKDGRDSYTAGTLYTNASELDVPYKNRGSISNALEECFLQQQSYQVGTMTYPPAEDIRLSRIDTARSQSKDARKIIFLTGFLDENDCSQLFNKLKGYNWSNYTLFILKGGLSDDFIAAVRAELSSFGDDLSFLDKNQTTELKELLHLEKEILPEPEPPIIEEKRSRTWLIAAVSLVIGMFIGNTVNVLYPERTEVNIPVNEDVRLKSIGLNQAEVFPEDTIDITLEFSSANFLEDSIEMSFGDEDSVISRLNFVIGNRSDRKVTVRTVFPIVSSLANQKLFCSYKDSQLEVLLSHGTPPPPPALPLPPEWSEPIPIDEISHPQNNEFRAWVNSETSLRENYGVDSGYNLEPSGDKNKHFRKAYASWYSDYILNTTGTTHTLDTESQSKPTNQNNTQAPVSTSQQSTSPVQQTTNPQDQNPPAETPKTNDSQGSPDEQDSSKNSSNQEDDFIPKM